MLGNKNAEDWRLKMPRMKKEGNFQ
jgi:hypothetical protein